MWNWFWGNTNELKLGRTCACNFLCGSDGLDFLHTCTCTYNGYETPSTFCPRGLSGKYPLFKSPHKLSRVCSCKDAATPAMKIKQEQVDHNLWIAFALASFKGKVYSMDQWRSIVKH